MCFNCGCRKKDDKMGDSHNIVLNDFAMAAIAMDINGADTIKNVKELLDETTPDELDERIAQLKEQHSKQHEDGHEDHLHHEGDSLGDEDQE
jgi:hypothetical protein